MTKGNIIVILLILLLSPFWLYVAAKMVGAGYTSGCQTAKRLMKGLVGRAAKSRGRQET